MKKIIKDVFEEKDNLCLRDGRQYQKSIRPLHQIYGYKYSIGTFHSRRY